MHNDGIFSSDFGAHTVGKDGQPMEVHLDKHEFYHGYLHGEGTLNSHNNISECSHASRVENSGWGCVCVWGGELSLQV